MQTRKLAMYSVGQPKPRFLCGSMCASGSTDRFQWFSDEPNKVIVNDSIHLWLCGGNSSGITLKSLDGSVSFRRSVAPWMVTIATAF